MISVNLNSCASKVVLAVTCSGVLACSHQIDMVSIPAGATIYEVTEKGKKSKVGKTPLVVNDRVDIEKRNFLFEAPGYIPQHLRIIFPYAAKAKITIYLNPLDDNWYKSVLENEYPEKVDAISLDLIELQNQLVISTPEQIDTIIRPYQDKYPRFSILPTMVGVFYYKHENFDMARRYLGEAMKLNTENKVARRLYQFIEGN